MRASRERGTTWGGTLPGARAALCHQTLSVRAWGPTTAELLQICPFWFPQRKQIIEWVRSCQGLFGPP